ncbi:indole-3-glycerol phosphate synthase TrpC [Chryseolinea lacunae]|uniref:Indole-3-glycerol phosphate synthase n=1 Tax=Chryseolinea lacunae TaxID=2801331 RepID=A0ABS1KWD1_9BACT|nr:indole-3-glycerol phosphate synthase TrpC [Chryseolinea lacunae]MBL0743503.1 indole-3-glycerol phosphate synthase TrpC [Chryseolinea lacunae]
MNILDQIIEHKKTEVEQRKSLYPVKLLEQSIYFATQPVSMKKYIQREDLSGIIAEIKRKSPSKGVINPHVSVERTSIGYMQAGASALSVLTDTNFFGGSNDDLTTARKFNFCPILRKDFTIDEYQIVEAKSIGADAILLIAAALEPKRLKALADFAHSFKLEVLLEVHNLEELQASLDAGADLMGVNNRNLKTFELSVEISKQLAQHIPDSMVKVSESGIESVETIMELKKYGYEGFLMGQNFMQHSRPEVACKEFIDELNKASRQA